jgi:hypothetical protein
MRTHSISALDRSTASGRIFFSLSLNVYFLKCSTKAEELGFQNIWGEGQGKG